MTLTALLDLSLTAEVARRRTRRTARDAGRYEGLPRLPWCRGSAKHAGPNPDHGRRALGVRRGRRGLPHLAGHAAGRLAPQDAARWPTWPDDVHDRIGHLKRVQELLAEGPGAEARDAGLPAGPGAGGQLGLDGEEGPRRGRGQVCERRRLRREELGERALT